MKFQVTPVIMAWVAAACISSGWWQPAISQTVTSENKPVIGINLDLNTEGSKYSISARYLDAIAQAGGIALPVPPMSAAELAQVLPNLDGMLMIGGDDYPPSSYGQKTEAKTSIMAPTRSQFDMLVVRTVLAQPPMPYLGICAGSQVLNIGSGGELIQDIPTAKPESKVAHSGKNGWQGNAAGSHVVTLSPGSKLASIYSGKASGSGKPLAFAVPTSHHQCVSKLGKDLQVAATTDDGVTEAIELPGDRFVVGVQWHPERDFENNSVLFAELIKQARAYRALKAKAALKSVAVGN
ncbi:gamma-glutamyl-gamma-aminobutyrate hydrolase family protein [bacterium]|nr:gamma-glutamyl-gamma-aminobutyrate hydrolase family protein [bacterium]MBP9810980.1 gamma-glutamyl-gamma-aminobutyrate hydrolase family protein [bacterium]